jgi:amidophosphoribosyltransferase
MTNMLALKDELRRKYGAPLGDNHSDTWVIPYLIHYSGASTLEEAIRYAASRLEGAFSLIIQSATKTWALRDRFGIRPLFYGKNPELGVTVIASETCTHEVFRIPGEECVRVRPGEMVTFEPGREPIHQLLLTRPPGVPSAFCGFEASYFARPDSIDPVMLKRYAVFRDVVGEMLAEQDIARDPTFRPDVVIAVPNSGIDFAQGYANRLGCPFRMALKRNQTEAGADRSFIAPTQEERAKLVKYKYILIPEWVRGKKVVMVDDSKVRGTTHIVLVERLFKAGATEVHTRLGYPMIKYYCYFAIDIATQKELVAHGRTLEEIAAFGGETSVDYITEENFLQAYGRVRGVPFEGQAPLCRGCVSGIYPCPRQDDSTEVLAGRAR